MTKRAEESGSVPKTAPICGCGHAVFYVLLLAVAAVVAAQWAVDPTTGGIAGFVGSALRLPPQGTWRVLGLLGGWLAGTLLAASVAKRALPADRGRAVWRRAFVVIGSALSAGLAGLLYTADGDLPRAVMFCCAAPAAGAVLLVHLPHRRRVIATAGITAGAALIVVGLVLTQQPSSALARARTSAPSPDRSASTRSRFSVQTNITVATLSSKHSPTLKPKETTYHESSISSLSAPKATLCARKYRIGCASPRTPCPCT